MPSDDLLEETWNEVYLGDLGEKKLEIQHGGNSENKDYTKPKFVALVKECLFNRADKLRTFNKTKDKIEEDTPTFQMYTK